MELFAKQCNICKTYLPKENFYRNCSTKDGLQSKCIDCALEYKKDRKVKLATTVRRAKIDVKKTEFFIPDIYLVGYGRTQMYQHCCLKCSKEFFCLIDDKLVSDLFCDLCDPDLKFIRDDNISMSPLIGNVVGWIVKGQGVDKHRSRRNYKKTYERDKYTCQYCGYNLKNANKFLPLHIDHVRPWSSAGGNGLGNLVVSCQDCNFVANNKWFDNFDEKKKFILGKRKVEYALETSETQKTNIEPTGNPCQTSSS